LRVFISYGCAEDQVTALRVQAIAEASGIEVYCPPLFTRKQCEAPPQGFDVFGVQIAWDWRDFMAGADAVLAIAGHGATQVFMDELSEARRLNKPIKLEYAIKCIPQLVPGLSAELTFENCRRVEALAPPSTVKLDAARISQLNALGWIASGLLILQEIKP